MKFVGAIVLLVAAALVFSITQPDAAPQMTMGLVIAVVTLGLVFAVAGTDRAEGATRKGMDPVRMLFGGVILIAGSIATFLAFSNVMMGILFAVVVLAGSGYMIYEQLNSRPSQNAEQMSPESLLRHDANASPLEKLKQGFHLGFDEELLERKNAIAMQMEALYARTHRTRTFGPLADTEIAANEGAQERQIPREDYSAYRLAELQGKAEHDLKKFEVDLRLYEQREGSRIDFNTAQDFATRVTAEASAIRKSLAGFHELLHFVKNSDDPEPVKRAKVADLVNTIKGLRQDLNGRMGLGQDDAAMGGKHSRRSHAPSEE